MDDRELKLRLIEAAAQLPGVRVGADHEVQAKRAREVARLWYTDINDGSAPGTKRRQQTRR